jgi:hypothetical protein
MMVISSQQRPEFEETRVYCEVAPLVQMIALGDMSKKKRASRARAREFGYAVIVWLCSQRK